MTRVNSCKCSVPGTQFARFRNGISGFCCKDFRHICCLLEDVVQPAGEGWCSRAVLGDGTWTPAEPGGDRDSPSVPLGCGMLAGPGEGGCSAPAPPPPSQPLPSPCAGLQQHQAEEP